MHFHLNITKQDLKRLKGPDTDFVILCNKVSKLVINQFITKHLSISNPNHTIDVISLESIKSNSEESKNIKSSINKLIEPNKNENKPRIYILQIDLKTIQKLKDITSFLLNNKIESGLIKKIYKDQLPVLLCKFIHKNPTYLENLKKAISLNPKPSSAASNFKPEYNLRVSHIIPPEELKGFNNSSETKKYLISRLRVMEFPKNEENIITFNAFLNHKKIHQELIQEVSVEKIQSELDRLPSSNKLQTLKQFEIYIADFNQIPNTMLEIGRLRELTFRKAKEGTGMALDLDTFDPYYLHLFLWDSQKLKIAGACRLVEGSKIIPILGKKGFYISTLFKLNDEFVKTLLQSVELGRTFITPQYQKSNLLLLMMWKSLYSYIFSKPENRYILGPVSISEEYSKISRLLIMDYLKKYYGHSEFHNLVKPRKPFRFIGNNASEKIIIRNFDKDINKLDKLISEIQYNSFKLPVLLRQYLKQSAKVIAFNKDPMFQNVLDALLILDHETMSGDLTELLKKEIKD